MYILRSAATSQLLCQTNNRCRRWDLECTAWLHDLSFSASFVHSFRHRNWKLFLLRRFFCSEASIMGAEGARAPPIFVVGGPYYWKGPSITYMDTVVLSGIYFCLRCQGKINISTNDHSACTKSHHFEWHVKKYWETLYPSPAHTLSFPDLGPPMLKPDRRLWFYYIVVRNLDICRRYLHDDRPTSIAKVKIYRGIS